MGNHSSYLDIPAVVIGLRPLGILFVAKRELLRSPFLGWALAVSHHIKIDRGNREQAVAALREARTKLRSGIALTVFPEGTRSPDGRLLPFKKGGFHMALDSEFPILPITIRGSRRLMGKKSFLPRPGTITVCVHPLRPTDGLTASDIPQLMQEVRSVIESGLEEEVRRPAPPPKGRAAKEGA
jgi:1-acyl-sn-glycerol-3-phosphate acyltransferase